MTTQADDAELLTVIARTLDIVPERLEPELRFEADLGLDSLAAVRVVMAVEDAIGRRFDDAQAAAVTSVGELLALVRRRRGGS